MLFIFEHSVLAGDFKNSGNSSKFKFDTLLYNSIINLSKLF